MDHKLRHLNNLEKIDKCNIEYYKYKFDHNPKLVKNFKKGKINENYWIHVNERNFKKFKSNLKCT